MRERYLNAEGFYVEVAEAYSHGPEGLTCLVIQTSEDRDIHMSEIDVCDDFSHEDPQTVFTFRGQIYSIVQKSSDAVYIAHTGKQLRYGPHTAPEVVLTLDADVTRLCDSARGVWIVGLGGYVAHFDGAGLVEVPVPGAETIYMVSEAPDGTVFASGSFGGLYRLEGREWVRVELPVGVDIYRILAKGRSDVWLAGQKGLCAHLMGEGLTLFTPPDDRHYRAIAEFRGKVYVGAGYFGLDVVEGDRVVPLKQNIPAFYLRGEEKYLFATGYNLAARFDGQDWLATEFT
ncbi:MAG: hypothetical protein AB1730_15740 [Myxococcota bacterium]